MTDISRLEERREWLGRQPGHDPREECPACGGDREVNGRACPECQTTDPLEEVARLRAGISWVRGMCSDGEPVEVIDARLGEVLRAA